MLDKKEWEELCDGCGKCCELKGSGGFACPALDCTTNRCTSYETRHDDYVCLGVTPDNTLMLHAKGILPDSCAYVRHLKGQPPLDRPVQEAKLIPFLASSDGLKTKYTLAKRAWDKLRST